LKVLAENGDNFQNLRKIILNYNQITEVGLSCLTKNGCKFKKLERIDFDHNQIKDEGL
jgi:hypothetical protein